MRSVSAVILLMFFASLSLASGIEQTRAAMIRNSPEYRHGEGYGATLEAAKEAAANSLAQSIRTMIRAEQLGEMVETEAGLSDSFVRRTTLVSMVQLQGLEYLDLGTVDGRHHVLAYISEEQLAASNRRQKDRIRSLLAHAESARRRAEIGSALRDAYFAYLLAQTIIDTVNLELPNPSGDPKYDLLIYLQSMLSDLEFIPGPAGKQGSIHLVQVECRYHGKPVSSLDLSYYGGAGQDYSHVTAGSCDLVLHLHPPLPCEYTVKLDVEYADRGAMIHREDLMALHDVFRERIIPEAWHTIRIPVPEGTTGPDRPRRHQPEPMIGHRVTPAPGMTAPPPAGEIDFAPGRGFLVVPDESRPIWPMPILVLSDPGLKNTRLFLQTLETFARHNRLAYDKKGPAALRDRGMDVFVTLATPDSVITTLHCLEDGYQDVRKDVHFDDLREALGDREAFQIWIGVPDGKRW